MSTSVNHRLYCDYPASQTSTTSRILVISINSNNIPTWQQSPSWIIGWTSTKSATEDDSVTMRRRKEMIIAATLLPPTTNLSDYQDIIARWQRQINNQTECTCVTDSLQISAVWNSRENRREPKTNLPKISPFHPYPWWNEELRNSAQQSFTHVLYFFSENSRNNYCTDFSHYSLERNNAFYWDFLLGCINHSKAVQEVIGSGKIPPALPYNRLSTNLFSMPTEKKHPTITAVNFGTSAFQSIKHMLLCNSLTYLHLRHCRTAASTPISSCLPLLRCIRGFQALSDLAKQCPQEAFVCDHCRKRCRLPSRSRIVKIRAQTLDIFTSTLLDAVLGVLVSIILFLIWHRSYYLGSMYLHAKLRIFQTLKDQIGWLETFPAGFKLNVRLTHNMGHEIRNLLDHHGNVVFAPSWSARFCNQFDVPLLVPFLALVAATGGWSLFLSVTVDMWRLENLHLALMAWVFRKLYQAELSLLSALFRLFRGNKRNIMRQRTDSMNYDAVQLLVGTIALCICVFLWTTVVVYYAFFLMWNLLMNLPILVLWIVYVISRNFSWGSLLYRLQHPCWFPKEVYIEFASSSASTLYFQETSLKTIPESTRAIIGKPIADPMKFAFRWTLSAMLEVTYPRRNNASPISFPLQSLMQDLGSHGAGVECVT